MIKSYKQMRFFDVSVDKESYTLNIYAINHIDMGVLPSMGVFPHLTLHVALVISILKYMGISPSFSAVLTQGDNSCDFLFASLDKKIMRPRITHLSSRMTKYLSSELM